MFLARKITILFVIYVSTAFEETFLQQMELKLPEVLAEFKKGNLPEDGLNKMKLFAAELITQLKK